AALAQAGPITTKSSRSRARILEQMRRNVNVLRTSVFEAALKFGVADKIDTPANFISDRLARLMMAPDADVAKWDAQVQRQADVIAQASNGLAIDAARLDAYTANKEGKDKDQAGTGELPQDHPLREDAQMWANALLSCDLVGSADKMILAASRHSLTLEVEIL